MQVRFWGSLGIFLAPVGSFLLLVRGNARARWRASQSVGSHGIAPHGHRYRTARSRHIAWLRRRGSVLVPAVGENSGEPCNGRAIPLATMQMHLGFGRVLHQGSDQ
jgi:hypothetical protein